MERATQSTYTLVLNSGLAAASFIFIGKHYLLQIFNLMDKRYFIMWPHASSTNKSPPKSKYATAHGARYIPCRNLKHFTELQGFLLLTAIDAAAMVAGVRRRCSGEREGVV